MDTWIQLHNLVNCLDKTSDKYQGILGHRQIYQRAAGEGKDGSTMLSQMFVTQWNSSSWRHTLNGFYWDPCQWLNDEVLSVVRYGWHRLMKHCLSTWPAFPVSPFLQILHLYIPHTSYDICFLSLCLIIVLAQHESRYILSCKSHCRFLLFVLWHLRHRLVFYVYLWSPLSRIFWVIYWNLFMFLGASCSQSLRLDHLLIDTMCYSSCRVTVAHRSVPCSPRQLQRNIGSRALIVAYTIWKFVTFLLSAIHVWHVLTLTALQ